MPLFGVWAAVVLVACTGTSWALTGCLVMVALAAEALRYALPIEYRHWVASRKKRSCSIEF